MAIIFESVNFIQTSSRFCPSSNAQCLVKLGPYVSGKYPKATAVCVPEVFALEYAPLFENSVGDQSPTATIGSVKSQISSFGVEFECSEVMRSSDQL